ncbi:hypothetical protein HGRIS_013532 [Hohenbuehelia grisea]|uniref:Translation initiation factor IF-2, mitochondrial n=1 Tax=Hohenbuehelia grisea TaxID=104357 RepID=A0ABR3IVP6_9AGAR
MHRQRQVLPIFKSARLNVRSSSTATKPKPLAQETETPPTPGSSNLGKWGTGASPISFASTSTSKVAGKWAAIPPASSGAAKWSLPPSASQASSSSASSPIPSSSPYPSGPQSFNSDARRQSSETPSSPAFQPPAPGEPRYTGRNIQSYPGLAKTERSSLPRPSSRATEPMPQRHARQSAAQRTRSEPTRRAEPVQAPSLSFANPSARANNKVPPQPYARTPARAPLDPYAKSKSRAPDASPAHSFATPTNTSASASASQQDDPRLDRGLAPHQRLRTKEQKQKENKEVRNQAEPQLTAKQKEISMADEEDEDSLSTVVPAEDSVDIPPANSKPGHYERRELHKSRGSVLQQMVNEEDPVIAVRMQSKHDETIKTKKKKLGALQEKRVSRDVYIPTTVSVGMLAKLLDVKLERLQRKMQQAGMGDEASYDHVLTSDYAVLLAEEFGQNPIVNDEAAFDIYPSPPHPNPSTLPSRPPVVTIMGHVDHGKTTLLDTLRSSSVAKGEAGGITQHIGAFSVPVPAGNGSSGGLRSITFLDTPGHAAFSAMRARGASVTDMVVLVVAADDGIMPQTKEVIELYKKDQGNAGLVVAINKVDKPDVDIELVQKELLVEGIQLEVFGGDVPSVEVSGLTGHGLPNLIETLSAMAEIQDLRAERDGQVHGYVLESKVQKGLGAVATVLVLRGCLKPGSHIISGVHHAKVRAMSDPSGKAVKAVYPGMAVTVSGWKSLPNAGDEVLQGSESDIKKAIINRTRQLEAQAALADVEAINATRRLERDRREAEPNSDGPSTQPYLQAAFDNEGGPKELRLIVKGDVSGSVEALVGALQGIGNHLAAVKIVSSGVGEVTESDVTMAKTVGGIVVGFSVPTPRAMEVLAAQNNVPIVSSTIIYRLMDDIKERVIALLPVIIETKVTGEANVLQLFDIHLKAKMTKKVAGCRVINGLVEKSHHARVIRNGEAIYDGTLDTMRYLKKDVTEVRKGSECGLSFENFSDLREGDLIQMYQRIEKPGTL